METMEMGMTVRDDETEIRAMAMAWSKALEDKDADRLVAEYVPDCVVFDVKPPHLILGREAYRRMWQQCLPYFPARFRSEHRDFTIAVGGDAAFAHTLHHIEPIGEPAPPGGFTWMRVTTGYRRIAGRWKVVHEHVSVPVDMVTGKAAFISDPGVR